MYTGDAYSCGTIFKITPSGTLTTLHSFNSTDGFLGYTAGSAQGLVQATDGNFYGTSPLGGANQGCGNGTGGGCGTVFKITPGGAFTLLYNFCSQPNCTDGFYPLTTLVQGTDGNLYGTTAFGGSGRYCGISPGGCGTVFKITPTGTLTTLYSFCPGGDPCPDGAFPNGLVQATDGNFYGTSNGGGPVAFDGTLFQITPSGTLTTLYSFCSQPNCADGGYPLWGADTSHRRKFLRDKQRFRRQLPAARYVRHGLPLLGWAQSHPLAIRSSDAVSRRRHPQSRWRVRRSAASSRHISQLPAPARIVQHPRERRSLSP